MQETVISQELFYQLLHCLAQFLKQIIKWFQVRGDGGHLLLVYGVLL